MSEYPQTVTARTPSDPSPATGRFRLAALLGPFLALALLSLITATSDAAAAGSTTAASPTVAMTGSTAIAPGALLPLALSSPLTETAPMTETAQLTLSVGDDTRIYLPTVFGRYPNPTSPTSPYPQSGSVDVSVNTFLAWTSDSFDDLDLTYEIYLDANQSMPTTLIGTNTIDNFSPGSLLLGTQYYWRIVAIDEEGRRARGPIWTFLTEAETANPDTDAMVFVPAGYFMMGCDQSNPAEQLCTYGQTHVNEPAHLVYLDSYYLDKYEVTTGEYRACVEAGACSSPRRTRSYSRGSYYGNANFALHPVIYVSWWDAQDFCAWEGKRLPTEAEWEKGARGPIDTRIWPWGNEPHDCGRLLYPEDKSCGHVRDTVRVGQFPRGASPYGAMDMAGNVFEWVQDRYDVLYYTYSPRENPQGPSFSRGNRYLPPQDEFDYPFFTIRGGSFRDSRYYRYVSHRHWGHWGDQSMEDIPYFRNNKVGFRCAVSAE